MVDDEMVKDGEILVGHRELPGPNELRDPVTRHELKKAFVWVGVVGGVALMIFLSQPLLLIFGGVVFAAMLDGGTRLLGRILPIGRGWRLMMVVVCVLAFLAWVVFLTGSTLADQFDTLRATVTGQFQRVIAFANAQHLIDTSPASQQTTEIGKQVMGSIGRVTSYVGTAVGAVTSGVMIAVIGVFLAMEPRLYERGVAWMFPVDNRLQLYATLQQMGHTLRRLMAGRLLGMAFEGVFVWLLLMIGGVPMATLLGVLAGLLAFLPNIGAIVTGILIIVVGFSGGTSMGFYATGVYLAVQLIDGYIVVPTVAKRSVDLAPALVLGAQLLLGAAFGLLGLMFADPVVAMIKVGLEQGSKRSAERAGDDDAA